MFKIAKLNVIQNENVAVKFVDQEEIRFNNGKKVSNKEFKTLSFEISNDIYSVSFDLNCEINKLLEIPMNKTIDFNNYIYRSECWLNINNKNGIEIEINAKITRYLNNHFIILINFNTDYFIDDAYCGMAELEFNLDDYLNNKSMV